MDIYEELEASLLEAVWLSRWNKDKTVLKAVLTPEEALKMTKDIVSTLNDSGFEIVEKSTNSYKILMYNGVMVDRNLLNKGIYITTKPHLCDKDSTIESLIEEAELSKDILGNSFVTEKYINNLKMCELVEYKLNKA